MLKKINYFCIRNTVLKGLLLYWYASVLVSKSSALIDRSLLGSQCKEKLTACLHESHWWAVDQAPVSESQ